LLGIQNKWATAERPHNVKAKQPDHHLRNNARTTAQYPCDARAQNKSTHAPTHEDDAREIIWRAGYLGNGVNHMQGKYSPRATVANCAKHLYETTFAHNGIFRVTVLFLAQDAFSVYSLRDICLAW
jgi:hypothetical protein